MYFLRNINMEKYIKNEEKDIKIFKIIIALFPFIIGLFYEFSSYFSGMILTFFLVYIIIKNKQIRFFMNFSFISIIMVNILYFTSIFYSIDKGMSFIGFLKFLPTIIFIIILMQFEKEKIEELLKFIPTSGVFMIFICILCKPIKGLEEFFYMNKRLGGFFQYSNTCALFFLMGVIVIAYNENLCKKDYIQLIILLLGILLTGSRSVFIFTLLSFLIIAISNKKVRKGLIIIFSLLILVTLIYVFISKDYSALGRFLTISVNSSTLLGRLLYYKDGLKLILEKPFGLGYMGYFYMEPKIQTGVYIIRYIHNDFLQLALDAGILASIFVLASMAISFFSKNTSKVKRHLILIIFLGGVVDFNFQFLIIPFILIMTLNIHTGNEVIIERKYINIINFSLIALSITFMYFSIAFFMTYINKDEIAVKMFSGNTESKTILLAEAKSPEEADKLADELIKQNKMSYLAYDAKALVATVNKDFKSMVYYKEKNLEIRKYWVSEYEDYASLLKRAISYYDKQNDEINKKKYIKKIKEVPKMLEAQKEKTSSLGFKINDKPIFELSEETQNYINNLN